MSPATNRFLALLRSPRDATIVVAHRGDSFHAPENTIDAASLAWSAGADAWELDVQLTRDGIPVVLHDESLARTTDVALRYRSDPRGRSGYRLSDFDLAEVLALDAGSWFVDKEGRPRTAEAFGTLGRLEQSRIAYFQSGSVRIPTLFDALRYTKEHDWVVNIEIKSFPEGPPDLVERVLDVVAEKGMETQVVLSSFDHSDIAKAYRPGREYALAILVSTPHYRTGEYAVELVGADAVHFAVDVLGSESIAYRRNPTARSLRVEVMQELKKRQIPVLAYTINDHGPDSLSDHLAQIGVDGLFTDDPESAKRYFDVYPQRGQPGPR
jgi:glycerophosphoryl diester phosphodiesterase